MAITRSQPYPAGADSNMDIQDEQDIYCLLVKVFWFQEKPSSTDPKNILYILYIHV